MKTPQILVLLLSCVLLWCAGCRESIESSSAEDQSSSKETKRLIAENELVPIAYISGDSETIHLFRSRFNKADIECMMEGSTVYSLSVRKKNLSAAMVLLQTDPSLEKRWLHIKKEKEGIGKEKGLFRNSERVNENTE